MKQLIQKIKENVFSIVGIEIITVTTIWGLVSILNLGLNVFAARELSVDNFGYFSSVAGLAMFSGVVGESIQAYVTKVIAKEPTGNHRIFRKKIASQITKIATIIIFVSLAFSSVSAQLIDLPAIFTVLAGVIVTGAIMSSAARGILMGRQFAKFAYVVFLTETFIKFVVGMVALLIYRNPVMLLLGYSIPSILSAIIVFFYTSRYDIGEDIVPDTESKGSISITFNMLLLSMLLTLDVVYLSQEVRVNYAAMVLLGKAVYFTTVAIVPLIFSKMAAVKEYAEGRKIFIRTFIFSLVAGLSVGVIIVLFRDPIMGFLLGDGKFEAIKPYVPYYVFGMSMYGIGYLSLNYLIVQNRYTAWWVTLPVVLLQFVAFYILQPTLQVAIYIQSGILTIIGVGLFIKALSYKFHK